MTKSEFILYLSEALAHLPGSERSRVLEYYEEMIDDRIESGMTEEDAVAAMGSIEEILKEAAPEALNERRIYVETKAAKSGTQFIVLREPVEELIANSVSAELHVLSADLPDGITARVDYNLAANEHCACNLSGGRLEVRYKHVKQRGFSLSNLFSVFGSSITITLANQTLIRGEIGASSGSIDLTGLVFTDSLEVTTASGNLDAHGVAIRGNCTLHTASGEITTHDLTCGDQLEIHTASGDMDLNGIRAGKIDVGTASGDPTLSEITCDELEANSASGDIDLHGILAEKISAGTSSGDLTLSGADCSGTIEMSTSSGDLTLTGANCPRSIEMSTVSGDIKIHDAQCTGEIHLSSNSGDIDGMLIPEDGYTFSTFSRTGDVRVPGTTGSCRVEIHTVSGDINF